MALWMRCRVVEEEGEGDEESIGLGMLVVELELSLSLEGEEEDEPPKMPPKAMVVKYPAAWLDAGRLLVKSIVLWIQDVE